MSPTPTAARHPSDTAAQHERAERPVRDAALSDTVTRPAVLPDAAGAVADHAARSAASGRAGLPLAVGDRVAGRFRLVEPLGRGGMGRVFKAYDELLDRPVAIKLIYDEAVRDRERRRACAIEARAAARLAHPGIARIFDGGFFDDHCFVVMELVEGETLAGILRRDGRLPVGRAVDLAIQVADALDAAHVEGVVHCDVKPSNIIVDEHGRARLVDFGIAHATTVTTATHDGLLYGSAEYVAPEQVESESVDGRTDIYALGIVLYEMLSGRTPFAGGSFASVVARRLAVDPPPIQRVAPDVPPALARVVTRALAREPGLRYQTAAELRDALLAIQTLLGVVDTATLPAPRQPTGPRLADARVWAAQAAAGARIAGRAAIVSARTTGRACTVGARATRRAAAAMLAGGRRAGDLLALVLVTTALAAVGGIALLRSQLPAARARVRAGTELAVAWGWVGLLVLTSTLATGRRRLRPWLARARRTAADIAAATSARVSRARAAAEPRLRRAGETARSRVISAQAAARMHAARALAAARPHLARACAALRDRSATCRRRARPFAVGAAGRARVAAVHAGAATDRLRRRGAEAAYRQLDALRPRSPTLALAGVAALMGYAMLALLLSSYAPAAARAALSAPADRPADAPGASAPVEALAPPADDGTPAAGDAAEGTSAPGNPAEGTAAPAPSLRMLGETHPVPVAEPRPVSTPAPAPPRP